MDNEVLISKYLSGEMANGEAKAFAGAEHDASFRENLAWDQAVQDTLARDAAAFPAFGIEPNSALLSRLATQSASKTIFGLAASKIALVAGGVAVLATAAYFLPRTTNPVSLPPPSIIRPAETPAKPMAEAPKPNPLAAPAQTPAAKPTAKHTEHATPVKPPLRLNDEDEKNPPKITNPTYQPPVK